MSGDVLWVRSRGSTPGEDGDGMSRFSGGLMAAAVDCQALDSDHCCPVECSRVQSIAVVLVEPVISDAGPTNARNGLCRPVSEPSRGRLSSRGHSWSLLARAFHWRTNLWMWGKIGSSIRGQKGTLRIITRCFDIDMPAVSLPGPPLETWFRGRNTSYALRAHRLLVSLERGAAQVPTGDPGAGGRGARPQPSRPVRLGDTTGHLLDRMQP